jgi:hypothetical protein
MKGETNFNTFHRTVMKLLINWHVIVFLLCLDRDRAGKIHVTFEAEWCVFGPPGQSSVAELVLQKHRDSCRASLSLPQDHQTQTGGFGSVALVQMHLHCRKINLSNSIQCVSVCNYYFYFLFKGKHHHHHPFLLLLISINYVS